MVIEVYPSRSVMLTTCSLTFKCLESTSNATASPDSGSLTGSLDAVISLIIQKL